MDKTWAAAIKEFFGKCNRKVENIAVFFIEGNEIKPFILGVGVEDEVFFDLMDIFRLAKVNGYKSFFIVHNHPNNMLAPSIQDIRITKVLLSHSESRNLQLLEHIIVNPDLNEFEKILTDYNEYFKYV